VTKKLSGIVIVTKQTEHEELTDDPYGSSGLIHRKKSEDKKALAYHGHSPAEDY
jgi:hypothetical protein